MAHFGSYLQGAELLHGFPALRDTQKHCRKAIFLTRISDWNACKNQVFSKIDSRFQFGKPERFSESQFFGVAFRMETQNIFVISHPDLHIL